MKLSLKLGRLFAIELETPDPVQVSPTDMVTALWAAMDSRPMPPPVFIDIDDEC